MVDHAGPPEHGIRPLLAASPMIMMMGALAVAAAVKNIGGNWSLFAAAAACGFVVFALGLRWWLFVCGFLAIMTVAHFTLVRPAAGADREQLGFEVAGAIASGSVAGATTGISVFMLWRLSRSGSAGETE